jgi:hypothetical protein
MMCEPLAEKAIPGFDINTVTFEVIGPVFDSDSGVLYSFKVLNCIGFEHDPVIWY